MKIFVKTLLLLLLLSFLSGSVYCQEKSSSQKSMTKKEWRQKKKEEKRYKKIVKENTKRVNSENDKGTNIKTYKRIRKFHRKAKRAKKNNTRVPLYKRILKKKRY